MNFLTVDSPLLTNILKRDGYLEIEAYVPGTIQSSPALVVNGEAVTEASFEPGLCTTTIPWENGRTIDLQELENLLPASDSNEWTLIEPHGYCLR